MTIPAHMPPDDDPPLRVVDDRDTEESPHDLRAERAVLGVLLNASQTGSDALTGTLDALTDLRAEHYYKPAHGALHALIKGRHDTDQPIDPSIALTVLQTMPRDLDALGGPAGIFDLIRDAPPGPNAPAHAHVITAHHSRRRLLQVAHHLRMRAKTAEDPDALEAATWATLAELAEPRPVAGEGLTFTSFTELLSTDPIPVQWLASPLIAEGRVTLLYAPGKAGKSLVAMEIACALATGRPILRTPGGRLEHVLYVDQEMTPDDWRTRLVDMGYGLADGPLLDQYLHLAQLQHWPPMDTPAGGAALAAEAERLHARIVIIDTASKVTGGEENSNDTQAALYRNSLIPLKRAGVAVLVLDHTGKDLERGARGATAKTDNIDLAFELLARGKDLISLRCTHKRIRDDDLDEPTFLRRLENPMRHSIELHPTSRDESGTLRPTYLMERASRYIEAHPGCGKLEVYAAISGKDKNKTIAVQQLITEGCVYVNVGANRKQEMHSFRPFREHEDHSDRDVREPPDDLE